MIGQQGQPVGAVLAGGLGRRLGGAKASLPLAGRPLVSYPVRALRQVLERVVIVAKPDTDLPDLPGVEVWVEPPVPRHPLSGLTHALRLAGENGVLVCACDLPLITPGLVREILARGSDGAPAVIVRAAGRWQPLLGYYRPAALEPLAGALRGGPPPLRDAVAALDPRLYDVDDATLLFNVNTREDVLEASGLLEGA